MGLMSFIKSAGEKLFGLGEAKAVEAGTASPEQVAALNSSAAAGIEKYILAQNLSVSGLDVQFDGATSTVTVAGIAADQATKEKVLLCCGNVAGVGGVNDMMTVEQPADESTWHTVVSGDTLSKIAKVAYGDAMKYPVIFEANKPMLTHPDKIYPGQLLRIPPLDD
jgi:nucleoid-associated protein YgaU